MELFCEKHFEDERVTIDNCEFDHCSFTGTTLVYNGGPVTMKHSTLVGVNLDTDNETVRRVVTLFRLLGFLRPEADAMSGVDDSGA